MYGTLKYVSHFGLVVRTFARKMKCPGLLRGGGRFKFLLIFG